MSILKYQPILFCLVWLSIPARSQDTLRLSRQQCETIFLKENLTLIASQLDVSMAEAMVKQARLWPNPTFGIDEVNLWTSQNGTNNSSYFGDELPPFLGNTHQQVSLSLEQLVITAGKRKKLIALEQVNADKALQYFEDLLRNLKLEFRNDLTQLQYLQLIRQTYSSQLSSIRQLTLAYEHQVSLGQKPKGEYIRLKALELEIARSVNEVNSEINAAQKELKMLMHLPHTAYVELEPADYFRATTQVDDLTISALISEAYDHRPDLEMARLENTYSDKLYSYERSQRVPDLTFKGGYDRGGSFMLNFVGFGVSMDLPVFDRNQGNIQRAKIAQDQSSLLLQQAESSVDHEIVLAYQNLQNAIAFYGQIDPGFEDELDHLLSGYTKNFADRNISMLEYLDFLDTYLENKKLILETGKEINEKSEELNYTIGTDIL